MDEEIKVYWKCENCDEENLYPDVQECETCGSAITEGAAKRALEQIEMMKAQAKARRLEEERRKREEERRARLEEKRRREAERLAAMKARYERLGKFLRVFPKALAIAMLVLMLAALVLGIVIMVVNPTTDLNSSMGILGANGSVLVKGLGERLGSAWLNLRTALGVTFSNFHPIQNIQNFIVQIVQILSGGV